MLYCFVDVRLRDNCVFLVLPGVPGTAAEGLRPRVVTDQGDRSVVVPADDNLGVVLQNYSLMVSSLFLFELLHWCEGRVPLQPVLPDCPSEEVIVGTQLVHQLQ